MAGSASTRGGTGGANSLLALLAACSNSADPGPVGAFDATDLGAGSTKAEVGGADAHTPAPSADFPVVSLPPPDLAAPPAAIEELPVEVVRVFDCIPEGVGDRLGLTDLTGGPVGEIAIRPHDRAECQYHVYADVGGQEVRLSAVPSGYLFAQGHQVSDLAIVCVNDIQHSRAPNGRRTIDAVRIACAVATDGVFTALADVVAPATEPPTDRRRPSAEGGFAPWIRVIEADAEGWAMSYIRDSTFQFMNLSDNGRPAEDGVFRVEIRSSSPQSGIVVGATDKITSITNPASGAPAEPWVPSDEERLQLEGVVSFDDGPCPTGCPVE